MHEEWPEYIDDGAGVASVPPRTDIADRWNKLNLTAALEHLAQRGEQVRNFRRLAVVFGALALIEGGVLLGLLLKYLSG